MKFSGRDLGIWALFCVLAGLTLLVYGVASFAAGRGELVMPLDDVYIHFQYARQMAAGQPYIYNPGLPPTSGATSFLYPYLLAAGYLLGFRDLNLGLWAMVLGMIALAISSWLVYRLVLVFRTPRWLALGTGVVFTATGAVSWHFMSGMETGLVILFTLGTLYFVVPLSLKSPLPVTEERENGRVRNTIICATALALLRPEGGLMALLAVGSLFFQLRGRMRKQYIVFLLIPVLAIGVQPLVNLLMTGSAVASGNASKSILGIVPFAWDEVIRRVLDNWGRMWVEFLTGSSPREGIYIAPLMLALSLIALIVLLRDRSWRWVGLMLVGWLALGTLAISTLDTAFWHFKRYQMPFMALLFPLAAWGLMTVWRWGSRTRYVMAAQSVVYVVGALTFSLTIQTWTAFLHHYALNGDYVYLQPLQMARWLQANTPANAVVAVHDTGLLRYVGGRTTIDMVGLTTPGAADYWRNGPGAVAEFLIQERPDYIASYGHGHGFGLGMLADTELYGEPLARFPVLLDPNYNVALAADFQGIYRPEWGALLPGQVVVQNSLRQYINSDLVDGVNERIIDVANLQIESRNNYHWSESENIEGFPTEAHQFSYQNCSQADCQLVDGGRRINGEESFSPRFAIDSGASRRPLLLITRLNPMYRGTYDLYVDDEYLTTRWIPEMPGQWLDVPVLIPENRFNNPIRIRIVPNVPDGYYMPFLHTIYVFSNPNENISGKSISSFQNGAIVLASAQLDYQAGASEMPIHFEWYTDGSAQGDYKLFVHVLDTDDQIVAQADTYPGNGTLPPGNWLPGILRDTVVVDLEETPPGQYRVAIGFYDPYTLERLQPEGGDESGRFFIGDVEIR